MLSMLVVSAQNVIPGILLSPDVRGRWGPPGNRPGKAAKPLSEADNALVHCCGHVVLLAAAPLMHVAVLCCIHNSKLSMHDVGHITMPDADNTLVACTPGYCALNAGDSNVVYTQHGAGHA